jgi:hypothetical protein
MPKQVDFNAVDIDWWQERDRASVVVFRYDDHEETVWEAWDDDARELVEDGFFKWENDTSLLDYLEEAGILEHFDDEEFWDSQEYD